MRLKRAAFTLIEILVVMVIIGITSSLIVLNIGNFYSSSRNSVAFVNEMHSLLQLLRYQAIFSLNTYGVEFSVGSYSFYVFDDRDSHWKALVNTDPFWKPRHYESDLVVTVNASEAAQGANTPQIIFYPSGEISPFVITIRQAKSNFGYKLTGSYGGNIELANQT